VASIVILSGSPSSGSRTLLLAREVERRLVSEGFTTHFINVRDLPAEDLLAARTDGDEIRRAVALVAGAQAIVVSTPVYKSAYAGVLKTFLDLLPQFAFAKKTVLPLASGGTLAHVLSIDYALRPVLAALGARHVVNGYFFLDKQLDKLPLADGSIGLRIDPAADEKFAPVFAEFVASVRAHRALDEAIPIDVRRAAGEYAARGDGPRAAPAASDGV
jgi:FMN reductase